MQMIVMKCFSSSGSYIIISATASVREFQYCCIIESVNIESDP